VATPLPDRPAKGARRFLVWVSRRLGALSWPLRLVLAAGSVALTALGVWLWPAGESSVCPSPLELRLLADPEVRPTAQAVVNGFLDSGENKDGDGCRRSGVTVYDAKATGAVDFLSGRPSESPLTQPDVWIPAARSAYAQAAGNGAGRARLEILGPIAYTPLVVAVPDTLSFSPTLRNGFRLAPILARLREDNEEQTLLRADPEYTLPAQLATVALYGEHSSAKPVDSGELSGYEQGMAELSPAPRTSQSLMCALAADNDLESRSPVLIPEQTMARFNLPAGHPERPGCASVVLNERIALYPTDTPVLDHPFVHVTWKGADRDAQAREAAVRRLHRWFTGEEGQRIVTGAGYRGAGESGPALPERGSPLDDPQTVLESPKLAPGTPGPGAVTRTLKRYREALGPGRVLYLLDSSGSMAEVWEGEGRAKALVSQSLDSLGGGDEYAIRAVASAPGAPSAHRGLVGFGRHDRDRVRRELEEAGTHPEEADIDRALREALDYLDARSEDDDRPGLIVLVTDDEDSARVTEDKRIALLERIGKAQARIVTVTLRRGGCVSGRLGRQIAAESGGRCLAASVDQAQDLEDEVARVGTGDAR
jgi:Mg-chelatase subunit ChlD